MAKKEKKTKATKKAVKKTEAAEPKKAKKKAKKSAPEPVKAEKSKKSKKKEGKPRRLWVSGLVREKDLTPKAKKLIAEADALEVRIADDRDALETKLNAIQKEVGGPSFEHPERGAMTIMHRNEKTFWRAKPAGK